MIKKLFFSCIIFVFCTNAHGQFNTIMSKKVEDPPVIVRPLYGPCLYENGEVMAIDSASIAVFQAACSLAVRHLYCHLEIWKQGSSN